MIESDKPSTEFIASIIFCLRLFLLSELNAFVNLVCQSSVNFPLSNNTFPISSTSSPASAKALPHVNFPVAAFAVRSASFANATACVVNSSVNPNTADFAFISSIVYWLIPDESNFKNSLNEFFCHPSISLIDVILLNLLPDISPKLLNRLPNSLNCK